MAYNREKEEEALLSPVVTALSFCFLSRLTMSLTLWVDSLFCYIFGFLFFFFSIDVDDLTLKSMTDATPRATFGIEFKKEGKRSE